jgi:hypothetical protein
MEATCSSQIYLTSSGLHTLYARRQNSRVNLLAVSQPTYFLKSLKFLNVLKSKLHAEQLTNRNK